MFRRRETRPLVKRLLATLWPRGGWLRAATYLVHRMRRLPGSPHSIAIGFACGAAISVTPLIGFHFALAALTAWLLGGSLLASAIGTTLGNPWTLPLIWLASFHLGAVLLGGGEWTELPATLTTAYIFDNPAAVLVPILVGSVPLGVLAGVVSYWIVRRAVIRYQSLRERRRGERTRARLGARLARERMAEE